MMAASCASQIFPFSNLKHIFDQKGKAGARATTSVTTVESTTTLAPPTTTDLLVPFFGPYAAYDQDDGYRGLQRPEYVVEKPKLAKTAARKPTTSVWRPTSGSKPPPTTTRRVPSKQPKLGGEDVKQNKRLVDTTARPQRQRFVETAYETSDYNDVDLAGAYSNDLHEHPLGDGDLGPLELLEPLEPPARYLTPPRLPGMLGDAPHSVADVAPAPSSPHEARATADDAATPTAPMPPVPATYLRPPGPPGPSDGPILFTLGLADVADAATSLSTNPAIKMGQPPWSPAATDWAPAAFAPAKATKPTKSTSHKAASKPAPGNALPGSGPGKSGKPGKPQGFPKHWQAAHADKGWGQSPQGGIGLHESDADGDLALALVESSATDSAAAGTSVVRPGHSDALQPAPRPPAPPRTAKPSAKPKNHKLASSAPAPPSRAVKHLNHRPGGSVLREDESKARPRYHKRPLNPLEQVRPVKIYELQRSILRCI